MGRKRKRKRISFISVVLIIALFFAETVSAEGFMPENETGTDRDEYDALYGTGTAADEITIDEDAGELLVVLKDGLSDRAVNDSIEAIDAVTDAGTETELLDEGSSVIKVEFSDNENAAEAAERILQNENVVFVQPNFIYELLDDEETPDDPDISKQWQLDAIDAYGAWSLSKGEHGVTVAVVDSGCSLIHEDLINNLNTELAYQAVVSEGYTYYYSDGTELYFDDMEAGPLTTDIGTNGDQTGHGTQVAGVISAVCNNGTGVAGISYNADILPVNVINRCLNSSTGAYSYYSFTEHVIRAYDYIFGLIDEGTVSNLRVINLSLGGYNPSSKDLLLETYIQRARQDYGIISVCAGGNRGNSSSYMEDGRNKRIYPGDCDYAVSVVSINKSNYADDPRRTSSSDFNEYKDIAAPGDSLYTTKYTSAGYGTFSGTSAAAPVVTGVFALLFAHENDLDADRAVRAVCNTARDITGNANNEFDGNAVCSEGWDMYTGYGLINAKAALLYLIAIEDEDDMTSLYGDETQEMFRDDTLENNWLITESGTIDPEKIGFTSSAPQVASVSSAGVITAKKPGLSVITASSHTGEKTATVTVRVMFYDVPSDHNYFGTVNWAADNNIAAGYSGDRTGYFGVTDNVTRGQAVQFLWRMYGKPEPKKTTQKFDDVPVTHNYYKAIQWASEEGIAAGYKSGKFKPSDNCTRGQLVTFLWRYAKIHNDTQDYGNYEGGAVTFTDVPLDHNYYGPVEWAYENGIAAGFKDRTFGVDKLCTRGQCATFLYRLVRKWPVMMSS